MPRRPFLLPWLISGLTAVADQLSKQVVTWAFAPGQSLPVLPPVLSFTYVQNTGAAFGLLKDQQALFIGIALLVICWIGWELLGRSPRSGAALWGASLVLGGAVGNLIDRVRIGYVVDFIDFHVWPVFNLGDSAITIGVGLLVWKTIRRC